jgi:hypothetical protein
MYMNQKQLLEALKADIEKYATELARQKNILALGEQLRVDVSIVPVPDVVVTVHAQKLSFTSRQLADLDPEDVEIIRKIGFGNVQSLKDIRDLFLRAKNHTLAEHTLLGPQEQLDVRQTVLGFNKRIYRSSRGRYSAERMIERDGVYYKLCKIMYT